MSFPDDIHSRRCSLCAKFLRRQRLIVYDFNAESLAAECPYYQIQQGLIELSLGPEPSRWRQAINWEPIPSNRTGYVAKMRSHDYTYEYWDVYLEPGQCSTTTLSSCLTLIIYLQVLYICQDFKSTSCLRAQTLSGHLSCQESLS